jgi:RimJ/RimL family protein N-acetyltransferase
VFRTTERNISGGTPATKGSSRERLRRLEWWGGIGELAYWVVPSARGRGVAPRAVEAVSGWAFSVLGLHRLELLHSVYNLASCRAAEKAGFVAEGTLRGQGRHTDGWHDMHLHGRVAT